MLSEINLTNYGTLFISFSRVFYPNIPFCLMCWDAVSVASAPTTALLSTLRSHLSRAVYPSLSIYHSFYFFLCVSLCNHPSILPVCYLFCSFGFHILCSDVAWVCLFSYRDSSFLFSPLLPYFRSSICHFYRRIPTSSRLRFSQADGSEHL